MRKKNVVLILLVNSVLMEAHAMVRSWIEIASFLGTTKSFSLVYTWTGGFARVCVYSLVDVYLCLVVWDFLSATHIVINSAKLSSLFSSESIFISFTLIERWSRALWRLKAFKLSSMGLMWLCWRPMYLTMRFKCTVVSLNEFKFISLKLTFSNLFTNGPMYFGLKLRTWLALLSLWF